MYALGAVSLVLLKLTEYCFMLGTMVSPNFRPTRHVFIEKVANAIMEIIHDQKEPLESEVYATSEMVLWRAC